MRVLKLSWSDTAADINAIESKSATESTSSLRMDRIRATATSSLFCWSGFGIRFWSLLLQGAKPTGDGAGGVTINATTGVSSHKQINTARIAFQLAARKRRIILSWKIRISHRMVYGEVMQDTHATELFFYR